MNVHQMAMKFALILLFLLPVSKMPAHQDAGEQGQHIGAADRHQHLLEKTAHDVDRVLELESVDSLHYVMETVRHTRADLPEDIPLIGFAGADHLDHAVMASHGVISQRLLPRSDGKGRAVACEVMVMTKSMQELIKDPGLVENAKELVAINC